MKTTTYKANQRRTIEQIKEEVEAKNPIRINIRSKSWKTGRWTQFQNGATITKYAKWLIEDRGFNEEQVMDYDCCYQASTICSTNHAVMIEDTKNGKWFQGNISQCNFFMNALRSEVESQIEMVSIPS